MAAAFVLIVLIGPVVELVVAVVVASYIGVLNTVLLVAAASLLGLFLLKIEGLAAIRGVRRDLSSGRSPAKGLINGALRLGGAVLLTLPGLISGAFGLLLLVPPIRALLVPVVATGLAKRATVAVSRIRIGGARFGGSPYGDVPGGPRSGNQHGEFIEAEGWDVEDRGALPSGDDSEHL